MEVSTISTGLRERKKQKTRETIIAVALELFEAQGYERTTVAEIADAAEVSPRTIFAYFPSKEDILFYDLPELQERLAVALQDRPEGTTALDALREFIVGTLTSGPKDTRRKRIIAADEALQGRWRARCGVLEQLVIAAIAEDLDAAPGDVRPQIVAAAGAAAFKLVHDPAAPPEPYSPERAMALVDEVMDFLRGGLEALRRR